MNTKQIIRQSLWTLISLFIVAAMAFGQGILKNGGVYRNTGTSTFKEVQNYSASVNGTIKNSGTINVTFTGGSKNFLNTNGTTRTGNVTNYIGGTGGTIVVGNNLNNNLAGSIFDNDTTSGTLSTLKIVGAITNAGTFDTDSGRVWYNGGAQSVFTATYGALVADQTGAKTIGATVTVNDSLRIDNSASLAVSTLQLDLKGATNIAQNSGALSAASGTVRYNGDRDQSLIATQYNILNLLGGTSGRVKTSPGGISFTSTTGTLSLASNDTLEVSSGTLDFTNLADARYTNSSAIRISSTSAPTLGSITNVGNFIYNSGSTQTLAAGTYTNLTLRAAGAKTFPSSISVTGSYAIEGTVGSRDYTGNTFSFAGTSGSQTIAGLSETFYILEFTGGATKTLAGTSFGASRLDVTGTSGVVTNNVTTVTLTNVTGVSMTIASGAELVNSSGKEITMNGDLELNGTLTNEGTISVY